MTTCWMCHGWGEIDKQPTGNTAWSDRTGGEHGERFPVFQLVPAFGTYTGELITCPFCDGAGRQ